MCQICIKLRFYNRCSIVNAIKSSLAKFFENIACLREIIKILLHIIYSTEINAVSQNQVLENNQKGMGPL